MSYKLPVLTCKRCGHKWTPRKEERPLTCPNCKSPYYDRERSKKGKGIREGMGNKKILTDYEKGFLEAGIDFEGTLTIRKLKNSSYSHGYEISPQGYISNTNVKLLEKVKNILGDGSIVLHQKYRSDKNWKTAYKYQFTRKSLRWILPQMHLTEKNQQQALVIRALELVEQGGHYCAGHKMNDKKYNELCMLNEEIRKCNNRGLNANWNKEIEKREGKVIPMADAIDALLGVPK